MIEVKNFKLNNGIVTFYYFKLQENGKVVLKEEFFYQKIKNKGRFILSEASNINGVL